jgi:hypothetical protein
MASIAGDGSSGTNPVAIVISHDCDLSQSPIGEPDVEVIVGFLIDTLDGSLANAKSTRTLHLPLSAGSKPINLCLDATKKVRLSKGLLAPHAPTAEHRLSPDELAVLQRWLARRYRRAAFPTGFNERLRTGKAEKKIADKMKPHGKAIQAVFFDVDGGVDCEKTDIKELYSLGVTVVYDGSDAINNEQISNSLKANIEEIFKKVFFDSKSKEWSGIELIYCEVASDTAITIAQARIMREWNLDHISLRDQANQPLHD